MAPGTQAPGMKALSMKALGRMVMAPQRSRDPGKMAPDMMALCMKALGILTFRRMALRKMVHCKMVLHILAPGIIALNTKTLDRVNHQIPYHCKLQIGPTVLNSIQTCFLVCMGP